jgi:predicted Zn finger-like uncharacterized protein
MYTQCPECQIAFRVTARVLQQAAGNVRCGSCGHAFNALQYLSEEMPQPASGDGQSGHDELAETSRRLLETLDELAGPEDVRIEDTGVEWRVLDEAVADAAAREPLDERRYDDNSPLPEDYDEDEDFRSPPAPQRREADKATATPEFESRQGDLALSEPEDWTDILEEVSDADIESFEVAEELAAIHTQLSSRDDTAATGDRPDDIDTQFNMQAEALGLDVTGTEEALTDEVPQLDESDFESGGVTSADDPSPVEELTAAAEESREPVGDEEADDNIELLAVGEEGEDDEIELLVIDDAEDTGVFELTDDDAQTEEYDDEHEAAAHRAGDGPGDRHEAGDDVLDGESSGEFDAQIEVADHSLAGGDDDEGLVAKQDSDDDETELSLDEDDNEEFDEVELAEDDEADRDAAFDADTETEPEADKTYDIPEPTEEEMTVNTEIDAELMAAADKDRDFTATLIGLENPEDLFNENSDEVETIIMEGEFIRNEVEKERLAAENAARSQLDDPVNLADTYAMSREKFRGGRRTYDPPAAGMIGAAAALLLLLAVQYIHNSRGDLATYGFFNQTIAPVYRVLGSPVTPNWDIKGWQFEATNGSVDDEETRLTIMSRLVNRSAQPLPYPLVHVSLTNRFEDIMGSRILEPGEYLAGDADPSQPVAPGENFTAVITIEEPSPDATGFKLNVCYRVAAGTVKCAIEDFKN